MSANVVTPAHIAALVLTAISGPTDPGAVHPVNVWHELHWSALPVADVADLPFPACMQAWRRLDWTNAEHVAGMLYDENVASVRYHYGNDAGLIPAVPPFTTSSIRAARQLSAADALQALAGYEYRACEHPEWLHGEARRWCSSFRRALCDVVSSGSDCWSIR